MIKVNWYPSYKRQMSHGHFHILITKHHHINAAEKLYLCLPAIANGQVRFIRTREPPVGSEDESPVQWIEAALCPITI